MPLVLVTCTGVCLDFYAVVVKTKQRVKILNAPAKVNMNPREKADTYNADDLINLFIFQLLHAYYLPIYLTIFSQHYVFTKLSQQTLLK